MAAIDTVRAANGARENGPAPRGGQCGYVSVGNVNKILQRIQTPGNQAELGMICSSSASDWSSFRG